jgi:hypothetical protein
MAARLYAARLRPLSSHGAGAVSHMTTVPKEGPLLAGGGAPPPALHRRRYDAGGTPPRSATALGPRSTGVGPAPLGDSAAGWHRDAGKGSGTPHDKRRGSSPPER